MKQYIRQYNPEADNKQVFNLWQGEFGKTWPLSGETFTKIISSGDNFVVENNKKIVSFITTQIVGEKASILTIVGKDNELLKFAIEYLKSRQVKKIQLGNGGNSYFWPGIPVNLPALIKFFTDNDWVFTEESYDLVRNTAGYQTPPFIFKRLRKIKIKTVQNQDIPAVLNFEQKNFPEWLFAYQHKIDINDLSDIYFAEDYDNQIIGTVLFFSSASQSAKENQIWKKLLGDDMGGIGCLGVRQDMRQKGIGLALAAYATEQLTARKVSNIYVGYTWLVDWYGKLGYKVWRQYKMSWRQL